MDYIAIYIAGLFVLATLCQWLAWRTHLPAILYLIITGFLIGPVIGVFDPDALFGDLLFPITTLGVAIILFEGSLTLRVREVQQFSRVIWRLCSVGVLVTWVGMATAAKFFTSLGWGESFVFGAMVSVTGPTVISPMLRSMQPSTRISNILRWEGIIVDPIGAMLGLMVLVFLEGHSLFQNAVFEIIKAFGIGTLIGLLGGYLIGAIIRFHWVPEYMLNLTTLAFVLAAFTLSNYFVHESGLIAVTVMGIFLANQRDVVVEHILHFKEHLSIMIISMLFLVLSARIELDAVLSVLPGGLLVLAVALFVVRPLAVWISGIGTTINAREKLLLSWVAPRGIVAAAISAVFAERLVAHGYESASALVPLTFMIIIGTVVIQSFTAKNVAMRLGLSDAQSQGVLIVGINRVSTAIAEALIKQGIKVLMTDSSWSSVRDARMRQIPVYHGNPLSESAEFDLDLSGLRNLMSITPNPEYNTLISTHFKPVFEPHHIYTIFTGSNDEKDNEKMSKKHSYQRIFEGEPSWSKISSLLSTGWEIRATGLSESYTVEDHRNSVDNRAILLGGITPKKKLRLATGQNKLELDEGWTALFLMPPKDTEKRNEQKKEARKQRVEKVERATEKSESSRKANDAPDKREEAQDERKDQD